MSTIAPAARTLASFDNAYAVAVQLREATGVTVSLGLTGKLCLDVEQLPVINEVISPTPSDVAWAQDFLADFEGRGRVIRDGSDLPRLGRAQKIEKLASAFGVQPAS